ncbi:MAG TPA: chromate resistance protein ChrB domain-containing protein [Tepidisphaeraceae bacterium]|nr:chromate resistance protein ChrB domain-containing protein [Tepidisphaeraceae bacterium]
MKFVTRANVGIDRMGCAWLVRRFVDRDAEFLFVSEGAKSLPQGAEPFDMPGVRLSHHGGHCSFVAMLKHFQLNDPVLRRIGRIIDEADTVQDQTLEPAATGLDLICRGIRLTSPDDRVALDRGATVYDALYAQLAAEPAEG